MATPSNQSFSCGIDIGVKNLCISFTEIGESSSQIVISYKGSLEGVSRYQTGNPPQLLLITPDPKASSHEAYVFILSQIPEFQKTLTAVIELQLSFNKSNMSRLDGVTYGFLRGLYPQMLVNLHGSGIRQKFITTALEGRDVSRVPIPRSYPESKHLSFHYVGCLYQAHYDYALSIEELASKMDDICDSVVYARIAYADLLSKIEKAGKPARKKRATK